MEYIRTTPERAGVASGNIEKWLRTLDSAGLSVHNVLISRGNRILFEKYIPPFDKSYLHREYSQTKSVAAIAVGFAVQFHRLSEREAVRQNRRLRWREMPEMSRRARVGRPWGIRRTDSVRKRAGEKTLEFGIYENRFGLFPQEGYSREVGSVPAHRNCYKCAASAAWTNANTLSLVVQIIDEYFGRLWIDLISDGDNVTVKMRRSAEDFLDEYSGEGTGRMA